MDPTSAGITPFAPSEWSMKMGLDCSGHVPCYCAEVMKHNQRMCRLCLASENMGEEAARKALTDKARAWIAEFSSRPCAGPTALDAALEAARQPDPPGE